MNNSKFLGHKDLSHNSPSNKAPIPVITTVTYCLATHSKCNGRYVDYSGKYIILCDCMCHKSPTRLKLQMQQQQVQQQMQQVDSSQLIVERMNP